MSEEEIQKYSEDMKKRREAIKEYRNFFVESSSETIMEHFKSKEEEVLRLAKWKFG